MRGDSSAAGLLRGRVVIPIHTERGQLPAYAGRSIDHADAKYLLPAGLQKSRVLFNLHRAAVGGPDTAIMVEGYFDCMKVHKGGMSCAVALMGCSLSTEEERLLTEHFKNIVLMLDADAAGQQASILIAGRLISRYTIDMVQLADGRQPDQLSSEEIRRVLCAAVRRPERHPNEITEDEKQM